MDAHSILSAIPSSEIKKGMYILICGKTCKITEVTFSKTGKHGHMKAFMVGNDIFTDKKYTYMCAGHKTVQQVFVLKTEYTFLYADKEKNEVQLLDQKGDLVFFHYDENTVSPEITEDKTILVTVTTAVEMYGTETILVSKITGYSQKLN